MRHFMTALTLVACALATPAFAGVSKISSPAVTKGKAEIEYFGTRYSDGGKKLNNKQNHLYEIEYGLTDNFKVGVEGKSERVTKKGHEFVGYGVEAQYELTQQGAWWLASAVKGEYFWGASKAKPDELEVKALLKRSLGANDVVANIGLEKQIGDNRAKSLAVSSKLQAVHNLNPHFNPAVEWHADYGKLNKLGDSDTAEHYVGPAITGDLFKLAGGDIGYTAGYYWGLTDDSADSAARLQLGYEIKF
jgi:hypothetical protein